MKITVTFDDADVELFAARVAERVEEILKAYARPMREGHDVLLTTDQASQLVHLALQTLAIYRTKGAARFTSASGVGSCIDEARSRPG